MVLRVVNLMTTALIVKTYWASDEGDAPGFLGWLRTCFCFAWHEDTINRSFLIGQAWHVPENCESVNRSSPSSARARPSYVGGNKIRTPRHRDLLRRQAQMILEDLRSQANACGHSVEDLHLNSSLLVSRIRQKNDRFLKWGSHQQEWSSCRFQSKTASSSSRSGRVSSRGSPVSTNTIQCRIVYYNLTCTYTVTDTDTKPNPSINAETCTGANLHRNPNPQILSISLPV